MKKIMTGFFCLLLIPLGAQELIGLYPNSFLEELRPLEFSEKEGWNVASPGAFTLDSGVLFLSVRKNRDGKLMLSPGTPVPLEGVIKRISLDLEMPRGVKSVWVVMTDSYGLIYKLPIVHNYNPLVPLYEGSKQESLSPGARFYQNRENPVGFLGFEVIVSSDFTGPMAIGNLTMVSDLFQYTDVDEVSNDW